MKLLFLSLVVSLVFIEYTNSKMTSNSFCENTNISLFKNIKNTETRLIKKS